MHTITILLTICVPRLEAIVTVDVWSAITIVRQSQSEIVQCKFVGSKDVRSKTVSCDSDRRIRGQLLG